MEEVNFRLKVEADKAVSNVEKVNDSFEKTADNVEKAEKQTKDLNKATKKSPGAIKKVSTAFKGLGTAIKAAGIGLLIGAVTKVIDFMGNFREVTVEVEKAFAGLNVVLGRAVEAAIALATMDFDRLMASFEGVEEEINNVTEAVEKQFQAEDKLFELRKRTIEQNAELEVEQQKQLKIVEDTTLSSEKRIAAAEELERVNKDLLQNQKDEIALQKEVLEQQKESEDNDNNKRQIQLEINRLTAQQTKLEGAKNEIERKASRQRRMIAEQDAKELKERQEKEREELEANEAAKNEIKLRFHNELMQGLGETAEAREKEREELEANEQAKLEIFKRFETEKVAAVIKSAELQAAEEEKQANLQAAANKAKIDLTLRGLQLVQEAVGEGTKVAKAAALAQATISAIEGTVNSFTTAAKSPITTFFPAYPYIKAGLAAGFGALQVSKIASTNAESGSTSGLSSSQSNSRGAAAQANQQAQAPDFNIVGDAGNNEIAGAIGNRNNRPQKSYVVSKEMTTQAELDRNIEEEASLG